MTASCYNNDLMRHYRQLHVLFARARNLPILSTLFTILHNWVAVGRVWAAKSDRAAVGRAALLLPPNLTPLDCLSGLTTLPTTGLIQQTEGQAYSPTDQF